MAADSNEQLLVRYAKLDVKAFDEFYRRNSKIIYGFLLSRLRSASEADDAMQETFMRLHKYIGTYDASQKAIAWVFTIARHVAIDAVKRRMRRREDFEANIDSLPMKQEVDVEVDLETLLRVLSDQERALIDARFLQEDSYEKIAAEQKISSVNARKKISRILSKIKTQKS